MARDRHREFKLALFRETCSRILDNPSLIENGRQHMQQFMAKDVRMSKYYRLWQSVIDLPPAEMCRRLLADTPEGDALRDSSPVFIVLPPSVRMRLARGKDTVVRRSR